MSNGTKKYFYVYYSYELWGRGYIGKRECKCLAEEDVRYFGSFRDKSFNPTEKIILQTFDTVEEALQAEIILHEFYQVDKNPHFANRARATSTAFYYSASGKDNPFYGKTVSQENAEKNRNYQLSLGENHPFRSEKFKARQAEMCKSENGPSKSPEAKRKMSVNISKVLRSLGDKHPSKGEKFKKTIRRHYEINGHPWTGRQHKDESKEKMRNSSCKYVYIFISPSGEVFETTNAHQFCKDNNLNNAAVYKVVSGKQTNHKGWKATRRPRTDEDK